jgi:hypothetical protein
VLAFTIINQYNPQPAKQLRLGEDEMSERLCHQLHWIACFVLASSVMALAQGTPLNLGPLTLNVPPGWQSNQLGNGQIQLYAPGSTLQQYFQVEFLPFEQTQVDVRQRHDTIIGNLSGMMRPGSTAQSGVLGKFIWIRLELQRAPGDIARIGVFFL